MKTLTAFAAALSLALVITGCDEKKSESASSGDGTVADTTTPGGSSPDMYSGGGEPPTDGGTEGGQPNYSSGGMPPGSGTGDESNYGSNGYGSSGMPPGSSTTNNGYPMPGANGTGDESNYGSNGYGSSGMPPGSSTTENGYPMPGGTGYSAPPGGSPVGDNQGSGTNTGYPMGSAPPGSTPPGSTPPGSTPPGTGYPMSPETGYTVPGGTGSAPGSSAPPLGMPPGGAYPGGPGYGTEGGAIPGSGGPGQPGGNGAAPQYPDGSAENAVVKFVFGVVGGEFKDFEKYISAKATGKLKEFRAGKPAETNKKSMKALVARVRPYNGRGAYQKRSGETAFVLENDKGRLIQFVLAKEGGRFMIRSMKDYEAPRRSVRGRR